MVCDEMAAGISGRSGICAIAVAAGGLAVAGQAGQGSSCHRSFRCQHARKETYETYGEEETGWPFARVRLGGGVRCVGSCNGSVGSGAAASALTRRRPRISQRLKESCAALHSAGDDGGKHHQQGESEVSAGRQEGEDSGDGGSGCGGQQDWTCGELKVASGPNELQQSSLDAVRQWRYKPFLLNGDPIEVKTTISVIYSLEK